MTIENHLKVKKKGILFRNQAQLSLPPKKTLGYAQRRTYQKIRKQ